MIRKIGRWVEVRLAQPPTPSKFRDAAEGYTSWTSRTYPVAVKGKIEYAWFVRSVNDDGQKDRDNETWTSLRTHGILKPTHWYDLPLPPTSRRSG